MTRALALCCVLVAFCANVAAASCTSDRVELRGPWGSAAFDVELAITPKDRNRGLMHRESLPRGAGMLFVFDPPQQVSFWMRNTLIPLDMIFVDRGGVVRRVHVNAVPGDETGIPGPPDTYAVLEINGGLSTVMGIGEGTQMRHPVFAPDAAWPCP